MMRKILTPLAAAALAAVIAVPGAIAKGDDDVRSVGKCTGGSSSKIKAKPDNGRIEVEFEVDQNRNGVTWRVRLMDNGQRVFRGSATTKPPSGSFSIQRRIANMAGQDHIKGVAKNRASGERCVARVAI